MLYFGHDGWIQVELNEFYKMDYSVTRFHEVLQQKNDVDEDSHRFEYFHLGFAYERVPSEIYSVPRRTRRALSNDVISLSVTQTKRSQNVPKSLSSMEDS